MRREAFAFVWVGYVLALSACSDAECAEGQRKIGNACVNQTQTRTDASAATASDDGDDLSADANNISRSEPDASVDSGPAPQDPDAATPTSTSPAVTSDAAADADVVPAGPVSPANPTVTPSPTPDPVPTPTPTPSAPTCVPSVEVCDGQDSNCNGQVDDGATCAPSANECVVTACSTGACGTTPKPAGAPCAKGQCDGQGTCAFCGDGIKNGPEQCDPQAPGVGTFLCSPECKSRRLYTPCIMDSNTPLASPDCDGNDLCGGERFCVPRAVNGNADTCPVLEGGYRQFVYGLGCFIACSSNTDCPALVPRCAQIAVSSPQSSAYCVHAE